METPRDSFAYLEYISVFTGFIYGYVATRFFSGWSAMINFRHAIRFSKEHLAWTILTFGLLIDVWWGSWIKGHMITHHVSYYYLSLLSPVIFYLISVIQFPPLSEDRFLDLRKYFISIRKRHYLIFIALFISFIISDYFFKRLIISNYYFNASAIALAIVGYFSRAKFLHRFILSMGWLMLIVHIIFQPSISSSGIDGFSLTEYLTVFTAFIYGFVASRFLSGWGVMILKFDRIRFSKEHVAWTFLAFGLLMDFWTGSWQRENYISLNIHYFILSLTLPMTFYVVVAVSFPNVKNADRVDLRDFYHSHKKFIYGLMAFAILCNGIIANIMEESEPISNTENLFRIVGIILALMAAFSPRQLMERVVLVLGWITLMTHVAV